MLRVVVGYAVLQPAARILRHGHVLQELQRHRAETRRIDPVVDEAAGQIELPSPVARGRCDGREIPVQHRLGRYEADGRGGIALLDTSLLAGEPEHPLLDTGPADRAAELVAVQAVARRREEVARVEAVGAEGLEAR